MALVDLSITFQTLLAIFGAITALVAGISAISKIFSPFKELKKQVEAHEKRLQAGDAKFEILENMMIKQSSMQKEICKSLIVMMNHQITGNGVDKLKAQQEELQRFLIDN